jgi:CRP-like cAMP-binding protein
METKHLRKLASIATEVEIPEGVIIYRPGDIGKSLYLIEEGEVVIEMDVPDQGLVTMLTVGPGELFGWSSLFPSERKMARARAVKLTKAIAIDASQLRQAWKTDYDLEYAVIKRIATVMADRIKITRRQLVDILASKSEE